MNYLKRLDRAFQNAPVLPLTPATRYVFFSDCHRGIGNNNDDFINNSDICYAALQYYYQYGFSYIENGDGDELWENRYLCRIQQAHHDIFSQICRFANENRAYMLYGNHDMTKEDMHSTPFNFLYYEGLILKSDLPSVTLRVTHGHQADTFNSVFGTLAGFLVRHLWAPLEQFGILEPTRAATNPSKIAKLEKKYISYAQKNNCHLLTGHNHKPYIGNHETPYYNCGSCVQPKHITCIELCSYNISLVKWYSTTEKIPLFNGIYTQCPPSFPIYIKREVLSFQSLL